MQRIRWAAAQSRVGIAGDVEDSMDGESGRAALGWAGLASSSGGPAVEAAASIGRRALLAGAAGLAVAGLPARAQPAFDHGYAAWTALLRRHVVVLRGGQESQVRYEGFAADRAALKSVLDSLSAVGPAAFEGFSRAQQMAFLVNAYNAFTVELILTRWPRLESIKDLGSLLSSPWKPKWVPLLGAKVSLDDIEHEMLRRRGRYDDPRVHFAVNCASIGCPALREEAFAAERLDAQLHAVVLRVGAALLPPEAFSLTSYLAHGTPVAAAACSDVAAQLVAASLRRAQPPADAPPRKLLVTDLDGVMWRGVVGEDGPEGVCAAAEGAGYPHFVYQTLLRRLRTQGVLLAVASRNDEDLARAPFRLPGSVLREEDFVAVCAGYGAKSARIRALAQQLALGLDAVVFVDDNPVELAEVAGALPEVRTLPFPDTVEALPAFLQARTGPARS